MAENDAKPNMLLCGTDPFLAHSKADRPRIATTPLLIDVFMKYQLVLQWPATSIRDYDSMIEIESVLSERLSKNSKVDGHDAGAGEMNIFVHTDDPIMAFKEIQATL